MRVLGVAAAFFAAAFFVVAPASAEPRLALVIANSTYQGAPPIATAAADAGLIAAALQKAGFDVTRSDDLTTQNMGDALGAFTGKVQAAAPNAVVFVYFSGYAVQANGDDHLVPIDAQITTAASVADVTLPLSALTKALGDIPSSARVIVLDAARDGNFGKVGGQPVAPGLALTTVPPGFMLAYSAAPDSYAPLASGSSSPYARALATLLAQPGLDIEQVFKGVRLQVNLATTGAQVPWTSSALDSDVKLVAAPAAGPAAPGIAAAPAQTLAPALGVSNIAVPPRKRRHITKSSMRGMSADEAYDTAIEDDSLRDYQWFVETHPDYTRAGQIWNIIGSRREGILWRRTMTLGSTRAYWNYLDRYPDGAHADIARSVLAERGQPLPSDYVAQPLDLPSGYSDEAMGLPDLMPDGFDRPANVFFGSPDPEFLPAPDDGSINFNFNFGKRKKRNQNQNQNQVNIHSNPLPVCPGCPGPDGKPTGLPPDSIVNNNGTPVTRDNSVVNGTPVTPINSPSKPITGDADQQKTMRDLQQRLKQPEQQQTSAACDEFGKAGNNATAAQRLRCFNDLTTTTSAPPHTPNPAAPSNPEQKASTNCVNGATNKQLSGCLDELGKVHDKRADDLQKTILKQLDDQTKKKTAEAEKKTAAEKADVEPDEPVQHLKDGGPNRWQTFLKQKCASPTGLTQADRDACKHLSKSDQDSHQPNRWQTFLKQKCASPAGLTQADRDWCSKSRAMGGTAAGQKPYVDSTRQPAKTAPQPASAASNSPTQTADQPKPQPTPGQKPYMEFSTQPSAATATTPAQPGASISSGVSADQGGDLDEAVARPGNKRNGLTIPSHTASQPKIVMPPPTAEQRRLSEQVQERLKAQSEAAQKQQATKSGGLTIPSHTASQPKIVMPPPTAEQRRLSEQVQERLKAQSEAAQKQQATKSGGLTIPSHTASQPKIVMPPPTAEQRRLSEQVQERLKAQSEAAQKQQAAKSGGLTIPSHTASQPKIVMPPPTLEQRRLSDQVQERLKARSEAPEKRPAMKSGGLTIPSSQQPMQAQKPQRDLLQQQQAQKTQQQDRLREQELQKQQAQQQQGRLHDQQIQQQQVQQKQQQEQLRERQLQQQQAQQKQQQEQLRERQLQQQQAQQKQQQEQLHSRQLQQQQVQQKEQQERLREQQLQQRQAQEKQQQERVRQQQLQQQAQQKQEQERLRQQQSQQAQQRAQQERAQQERMRAQQQAQQRAQQMRSQQQAQQRAQQERLRAQQQGRAREMQQRAMQQRQMQQRQAQMRMMQQRQMQQRMMQQRHAQAPSCPQGSHFMNGRCVR